MNTPYAEGHAAGYRNEPLSSNPYFKGIEITDGQLPWIMEWLRGYCDGQTQGHGDLLAKRRDACR